MDTAFSIQKPSNDKKPQCDFMPRKSLEEVLDDLKDRFSTYYTHEMIQVGLNESIVKKKGRYNKQSNPYGNFTNKRPHWFISRNLRNQQRDHQSSIPVIEVDDHFSEDEIDNFIGQEDVDD